MRRRDRKIQAIRIRLTDQMAARILAATPPGEPLVVPDVHNRWLPLDRCGPKHKREDGIYLDYLRLDGPETPEVGS